MDKTHLIDKLVEALRFYCNQNNYDEDGVPGKLVGCELETDCGTEHDASFEPDFGEVVRIALYDWERFL